jgi:hypothetical protein
MNLGNEMVEEGVTIIKIDKPRGIAILVRKSLIRFEHVLIQELKEKLNPLSQISLRDILFHFKVVFKYA